MSEQLSTRFDPQAIESSLYASWQEAGYFHVDPDRVLKDGADPFVIVIPPPNVTAVLHMGHGLNNTIQDVLIRWRRMQGRASEWLPGTDHAGIATQNVVERLLAKEGMTRDDLGREAFVERVWSYVHETGGTILKQLEAIGCSCDWDRTAFTLDDGLSRAVREVFVRLYEKDLIYRGEYIINWCPRCLTALSNEEAEGEETEGRLYHLRYPLAQSAYQAAEAARSAGAEAIGQLDDGRWYLTVSTTRPETMLGDTGVAVNPKDERYQALVGALVDLPLTGRTIPIVADAYVDAEFGTGMVKLTPAHDPNDFEIARRTGVELIDVMTDHAVMNENAPRAFQGMDRFDARQAVLDAFDAEGLLAGSDAHTHSVPHCYRCHTVVEPRLSEQWFVKMTPLAKPALEASRDGTIRFTPARWQKVYDHWLENIRDWCISRQLWWGHRIPVWYCGDCSETVVAVTDPDACTACGSENLEQDPDVLDTWFSSQLWPFSTFGWPDKTPDLAAFYPGHVLSTAPEILFFWVARMIMIGYEILDEPPFTDVYLHGTVRDNQGRKMSKSLGNGIDPLEVVNLFGADALRFTLISSAGVGTDLYLDPADLEASFATGRNFANKLWNAGRFTLTSVGDGPVRPLAEVEAHLDLSDRWILSRLSRATTEVTRHLERFRLHDVADTLYHFFWGEFADWYLELVKGRLKDEGSDATEAARSTLVAVFDGICRLLHPLIPFVTEELWLRLPWPEGSVRPASLMIAPWPSPNETHVDSAAEEQLAALQELITQVRSLRKEYGVGEGQRVTLVLSSAPAAFADTLGTQGEALERLARVGTFELSDSSGAGNSTVARIGAHAVMENGTEIFLPLDGVIDISREVGRLRDEIDRLRQQLTGAHKMLANENFVSRAPDHVVDREREKVNSLTEQVGKLEEKLSHLEGH